MSKKLFVGNLAFAATEEDLEKAFGAFGDIEDAKIILDRETGRSRGFAFVTFYSKDAAEAALSLDGQDLAGRTMRVNFATEREGGSGGGGGGGRGGRRGYGGGRR